MKRPPVNAMRQWATAAMVCLALSLFTSAIVSANPPLAHRPAQPQPLFRVPAPQQEQDAPKGDYYEATGNPFPTFQQVPLPPVPDGSGWTWTYHHSHWDGDGCLVDTVSYGGAQYDLIACCPEPTMHFPCPDN